MKKRRDSSFFWKMLSLLLFLYIVFSKKAEIKQIYINPPTLPKNDPEISKPVLKKKDTIIYEGMVAIVIDDMGQSKKRAVEFANLGIPLTMAILPHLRHSSAIFDLSKELGFSTILHLPMEPRDKSVKTEKDNIFIDMSKKKILSILDGTLKQFQGIEGINNHMGSLASENGRVMRIVLKEMKKRKLFFLDSMTSSRSKGFAIAREVGVRTLKRDVFLDNEQNVKYVEGQIEELIRIAKKSGLGVGIGHPHKSTLTGIKNKIERFEKEGLKLVFLSEML